MESWGTDTHHGLLMCAKSVVLDGSLASTQICSDVDVCVEIIRENTAVPHPTDTWVEGPQPVPALPLEMAECSSVDFVRHFLKIKKKYNSSSFRF